jgi:hypothetical protein
VDPAAKAGVAIVAVNNPYLDEDLVESYKICSDPIDNHPLMENVYYPDNIENGIMFACEISDAAKEIKEIPDHLKELDLLM